MVTKKDVEKAREWAVAAYAAAMAAAWDAKAEAAEAAYAAWAEYFKLKEEFEKGNITA